MISLTPLVSLSARIGTVLFVLLAAEIVVAANVDVAVKASDGSMAVGMTVVLKNALTGFEAERTSNAAGRARFSTVPAGPGYAVFVDDMELAGGIRLRSNESRSVPVRMIDNITVTARPASLTVNALDAEVSASLGRQELEALPVEARDVSRALIRLPNVVPSTGFFPEAPPVSINGANGLFAQYLIDGMDNNENFLGGPKFPISTGAASDVTVLASSYSVEYGRTGNGVVNVTSRGGSNDWYSELFYLVRPGASVDASSPFAGRDLSGNAVRDGFRRDQYGFSIGGPIVKDRSFFFANVEYTDDDKDNLLSSPALGVNTTVPGQNESLLASLKLDHRISEDWQLSFRGNVGNIEIERQGGGLDGGVTFPSAGSVQQRDSLLSALSAVYDRGTFTSETRILFATFDWDYARPLANDDPQVIVETPDGLTAAVLGHPGFAFDESEESLQFRQNFTWLTGVHSLKFGIDAMRSDFALTGGGNPRGSYRVRLTEPELAQVRGLGRGAALAVSDIPSTAEVINYAVELRPASFGDVQNQVSVYFEDQVSVSQDLTVTAGLRWDYDSLTKAGSGSADGNNVAPRIALNYAMTERLSFRGGAGAFYERIPYTVLSDALQQNTTSAAFRDQLTALAAAGRLPSDVDPVALTFDGNLSVNPACPDGYLQCPTPADASGLRDTAVSNERRILNPEGLDSPYTLQLSAGIQWQFSDDWLGSADLLYYRGHNQLRLRDLNGAAPFTPDSANLTDETLAALRALPTDAERRSLAETLGLIRSQAAADATRPVAPVAGGARQIVVTETAGDSRYKALNLTVEKPAAGNAWGMLMTYTLSELTNNTDDINFRSANSNRFADEWGPSVNDRRHVISSVFYLYPSDTVTVSVAAQIESGQPVNLIPDTGIYGTTDLNGDGASFTDAYLGNSDRAPGVSRNADRLPWSATVDLGLRYEPRIGDGRLQVSADVFNVFNRENLSGFANSATQSNQIQVFGRPFTQRNAGAPRQFQFGLRYLF
ncbi:MAG: TonB-dependent receptor [Gammaproteobacteria bacterium]|nr:TonB-dependent receptor [Gammaproteobacteria bacterium]